MNKLIILCFVAVLLSGCGGNTATVNNATNTANNTVNSNPNTNVTNKNATNTNVTNAANTNKTANTTVAKPAETGPKLISFAKGKTESTENITLAPGASVQFILGATGAQTLFVTPGAKDLTFKMLKGIGGEFVKADDGTYSAETKGNNAAKGEIVFEVKNTTGKEIKTSLKIAIEDFAD